MEYQVAIPTYHRHETIYQKTLQTLLQGGVNPKQITLFVANHEEKEAYETALQEHTPSYHKIVVGKPGLTPQRIFISNHYPPDTNIFSVDDDIEGFDKLPGPLFPKSPHAHSQTRRKSKTQNKTRRNTNPQLVPLRDLDAFLKQAFQYTRDKGLYLWGLYPTHNSFYMKPKITTDLRFIIGSAYGYINRPHAHDLEPKTPLKGDYEQSILYYRKDGGVVRFNHIAVKTKIYAKGGLEKVQERIKSSHKAAQYLLKTYPEYVRSRPKRPNGISEIALRKSHKDL